MAKSGDYVVLPFGTLVAVLSTGTVQVKVPTKQTGRPTEDFAVLEFDQGFLQFVSGILPSHPIVIPPGEPGSPTNPIVLPGEPTHPIVIPPAPGHPDAGLPGGGHVSGQPVPGGGHPSGQPVPGGGHPDNELPPAAGTKPTPVPPATPKK